MKIKRKIKEYSDNPIQTLKENTPKFLFLYNLSTFVVYLGTIFAGWYFVSLAYTVGIPTYDILCLDCKFVYHALVVSIMTFWLFCLYFYVLNEIRFRFWHYIRETWHTTIKSSNFYLTILAIALTCLTFLNFIK